MYEIVIKNGTIVDPVHGCYKANVGIENGRIMTISNTKLTGTNYIDATDKYISPGFIDIHMHEDLPEDCVEWNEVKSIKYEIFKHMARMGVTTSIGGNCGLGDLNISKYYNIINKQGAPTNYLGFVGNVRLREAVGNHDCYAPSSNSQLKSMGQMLRKELKDGAIGLAFGLEYAPGTSLEEIIYLSKIVSEYPDKMVAIHYRFDASRSLEAIAEMIIVARETGVKLQISHIGSCSAFGYMEESLRMISEARKNNIDIMADVYPYDAFSTMIGSAVFDSGCFERWNKDYDSIVIGNGPYAGTTCDHKLFNHLRNNDPDTLAIAFVMDEEEVSKAIEHPLTMIASDGLLQQGKGHPRASSTFPRVLRKYVREDKRLSLQDAISKMTLVPANRIGLKDRGRLKEGFIADITIFDFDKITDKATYQEPVKPPVGIEYVLVQGKPVVFNGELTGDYPGVTLL
ncbi:N-acyl-D-amino-acid deacylase family protein [Natranaerobius thermophilus]|uniref:D-aminoacylase domain protein n=1 Tax=Natranaerobius thermophilus (strain ATCC BAA-1301 / DSM 18059 / JW/NM-WN-LF) TaxID=457570 RepID=B2A607_NATTJ|nr:amidohydrolase family protein [Natranaerobius thermophilus]ACB85424.1 D-aminoacylase domain protein [Natranaerobius thermophilus JW/NM-WN-LF]